MSPTTDHGMALAPPLAPIPGVARTLPLAPTLGVAHDIPDLRSQRARRGTDVPTCSSYPRGHDSARTATQTQGRRPIRRADATRR